MTSKTQNKSPYYARARRKLSEKLGSEKGAGFIKQIAWGNGVMR